MKTCENCFNDFQQIQGMYELNFGWVCFDCYEEISDVFNLEYFNYPTCKDCGKELLNLNIENEYCPKCLFKEIDEVEGMMRNELC